MRATNLYRLDWEMRHCGIRGIDILAAALGYGVLLSLFVGGVTAIVDALQGNPQTVLPQIVAVLEWIDGGPAR
ncbi:MAG: hypothetical protein LT106_18805 [Burkholderiaceae bacterium]|nr:hypothetical protein [Burkholderiaceae bacterium]